MSRKAPPIYNDNSIDDKMTTTYTLSKSPLVASGGLLHWNIDSSSNPHPIKVSSGRVELNGWLLRRFSR